MTPKILLLLAGWLIVSVVAGQCDYNGKPLERFYIDTIRNNSHHEFQVSPDFTGRDSYVGDQHRFFDSMHVITFDSALAIACRAYGLETTLATLEVQLTGKAVWVLNGPEKVSFNGRGPGNATITTEEVRIDASTGKLISRKKRKYRAIVDF